MMKDTAEVTLETILISVLNVTAVYVAAFTYKLNWSGVMTVMILASLLTATVTHFILSKIIAAKMRTEALISESLGVLGVAFLSSLAVLIILVQRFNLPEALGISLLSGLLTSLIRNTLV
jgi:hypothetical protein